MIVSVVTSLIATIVIERIIIAILKKRKAFQLIYHLSPIKHQEKAQTPSFGGIGIMAGICIGSMVYHFFYAPFSRAVLWCIAVTMVFAVLGYIDDRLSVKNNKNKGLSAKSKLFIQLSLATLMLIVYHLYITPLSMLSAAVTVVVMVGSSNATNLTDGIDGLLASLSVLTCIGFYIVAKPYAPELLPLILITCATIIGFLTLNKHPAAIFMGDTGSLAIGALFSSFAIMLNDVWLLLGFGAIYVLETTSVIVQVIVYKVRKIRLFLMSPLHHHFELIGFKEPTVVTIFCTIQGIFILITLYGRSLL